MFSKNKKKIIVQENNHFLKITIPKKYSFGKFNNALKKLNIDDELKRKIIGSVLKYDSDIINEDKKIPTLKIYFINNDNSSYEIIKENNDNLLISKIVTSDQIYETSIEIKNNNYVINKLIHNINGSTKSIKTYSSLDDLEIDKMSKEEAFLLAKHFLDDLFSNNVIKDIININDLFEALNIVTEDKYNPVISDDVISLCSTRKEENINSEKFCYFNIILNSTYEVIGDIDFNYQVSGPSSLGNVMYNIKENYRNNHYCTRALALLKKLLKNNTFDGDKNLYIAAINEYSIRVAKANGGVEIPYKYTDENYDDNSFDDEVIKEEQKVPTMLKINI